MATNKKWAGAMLGIVFVAMAVASQAVANRPARGKQPATLTLLGTAGGPGGLAERAGIASLVTVSGKYFLIDAGEGVSRQLARAGVAERDIGTVFLTHLHDDHTAGLPGMMSFAYTLRSKGMELIGPPRTQRLLDTILEFMGVNAEIRMAERRMPAPVAVFRARDVEPGQVYSDGSTTVTAVENTHFHLQVGTTAFDNKSYSYRFDTPGKSIVLTGDTGPSDAVIKLARNADILVAEMVSANDIKGVPREIVPHMLTEHLSATEVGKMAARANVRLLVLSHIRDVSRADIAEIRRNFRGRIVVGSDLARF